jgi:hypothetical protein
VDSRPDLPLCRETSNCSSLHPSRRLSVFDQASGFLSKTQIWEDCCNRSDDVDSRPDTLIHKASIAIQIQTSGRASIRYENCVHPISCPNDHPRSLDARSLCMEITCSERATVQTTGHHCPDAALKQERSSAKVLEFRSNSCLSGRPMTTIRTTPSFIKPDAHLNF